MIVERVVIRRAVRIRETREIEAYVAVTLRRTARSEAERKVQLVSVRCDELTGRGSARRILTMRAVERCLADLGGSSRSPARPQGPRRGVGQT